MYRHQRQLVLFSSHGQVDSAIQPNTDHPPMCPWMCVAHLQHTWLRYGHSNSGSTPGILSNIDIVHDVKTWEQNFFFFLIASTYSTDHQSAPGKVFFSRKSHRKSEVKIRLSNSGGPNWVRTFLFICGNSSPCLLDLSEYHLNQFSAF